LWGLCGAVGAVLVAVVAMRALGVANTDSEPGVAPLAAMPSQQSSSTPGATEGAATSETPIPERVSAPPSDPRLRNIPKKFPRLPPEELAALLANPSARIGEAFKVTAMVHPVGKRTFDLYGTGIGAILSSTKQIQDAPEKSFAYLIPTKRSKDLLVGSATQASASASGHKLRVRILSVDYFSGEPTAILEVFGTKPLSIKPRGAIEKLQIGNKNMQLLLDLHDHGFDVVQQLQGVVG